MFNHYFPYVICMFVAIIVAMFICDELDNRDWFKKRADTRAMAALEAMRYTDIRHK